MKFIEWNKAFVESENRWTTDVEEWMLEHGPPTDTIEIIDRDTRDPDGFSIVLFVGKSWDVPKNAQEVLRLEYYKSVGGMWCVAAIGTNDDRTENRGTIGWEVRWAETAWEPEEVVESYSIGEAK